MYPLEEREEDPPRDPDRRDDPPPRSLPPRSPPPRSPPPARRRPAGFLFRPAAARRVFPSSFRRMFSTRRLCVVRRCTRLVRGCAQGVVRGCMGGGRWQGWREVAGGGWKWKMEEGWVYGEEWGVRWARAYTYRDQHGTVQNPLHVNGVHVYGWRGGRFTRAVSLPGRPSRAPGAACQT